MARLAGKPAQQRVGPQLAGDAERVAARLVVSLRTRLKIRMEWLKLGTQGVPIAAVPVQMVAMVG